MRNKVEITTQGGDYLGRGTLEKWNIMFTMESKSKTQIPWNPIFLKEPFGR